MMAEENKNANSYDGRDGDGAFLVALPHPWRKPSEDTVLVRPTCTGSPPTPLAKPSEDTVFQTPVFVWGKRIMVNIEGGKKNSLSIESDAQPDKKNRGRAMRVTLPCEWGRHCSTVAASPKHGTARCLSPPTNTTFVEWGGGNRLCSPWRRPSTALQIT